ncbi:MAG: Rhs family protein, partial [Betaproteobacteria bacterium]|nr:Rhs family protein [Betaproteobacteria bacterium]
MTDPLGRYEDYTYDSGGRMTVVKDKRGNTMVTNAYDGQGRVSSQTAPGNAVTTFTYTPTGSGPITRTDVTDPLGHVTRMNFNAAGQMTSRIDAYGTARAQTTTFEYNAAGLRTAVVDALNRRTEYSYDAYGNLTQVKYLAGTGSQYTESFSYKTWSFHELATSTDPRGKVTSYTYDIRGRLTQVSDPLGNLTKFTYNAQGLVTQLTDPRNQVTQFSYSLTDLSAVTDPLGRTTALFTDPLGRVVQTTNALGHRSTTSYDVLH